MILGVEFLPLGATGLGTAAGWGLILRPWLRSPLVKPTLPLPFDVPGRSQPASTDSPTPTRVERATKDRRDVIRGAVLSERENAEGAGTPLMAPPEISQRQNLIVLLSPIAMGAPWVLPSIPMYSPSLHGEYPDSLGLPMGTPGTARIFPVGVSPFLE